MSHKHIAVRVSRYTGSHNNWSMAIEPDGNGWTDRRSRPRVACSYVHVTPVPWYAAGVLNPRWTLFDAAESGFCAAVLLTVVGSHAIGCYDPSHLKPTTTATIEAGNAAICPFWMPLATTALAGKLGPFAGLLSTALTCSAEEAAVAALLAELTAPVATDAGAGVATSAITASSPGLVPVVRRRDGKPVLMVPPSMAPQCQAAQDRIDARGGA